MKTTTKIKVLVCIVILFGMLAFKVFVSSPDSYKIENWQVKNNNKQLHLGGYLKPLESEINNFNDGRIFSVSAYRQALVNEAVKHGIEISILQKTLQIADRELEKAPGIPIIIEAAKYQNQNVLLIIYQLEHFHNPQLSYLKDLFTRTHHHHLVVVVSQENGKVLVSNY